MQDQEFRRTRFRVVGAAALAALAHLAWEHTHGGVQSHHLLNRADLPAISNLWALVVLPALAWLAAGALTRRGSTQAHARRNAAFAFSGALLLGAALAAAFAAGREAICAVLFFGMLASGLVLRTYRAEYALGFVLGMTFVFGAVLPMLMACIAALISLASHRLAWPAFAWAFGRMRGPVR